MLAPLSARVAQILGARSPWRLNFVRWRLIVLGLRRGNFFIPPSRRLGFSVAPGFFIFWKFVNPCSVHVLYSLVFQYKCTSLYGSYQVIEVLQGYLSLYRGLSYGLHGTEFNSRRWKRFYLLRNVIELYHTSYSMGTRVKTAGAWRWPLIWI
jgi:hypothetical protein